MDTRGHPNSIAPTGNSPPQSTVSLVYLRSYQVGGEGLTGGELCTAVVLFPRFSMAEAAADLLQPPPTSHVSLCAPADPAAAHGHCAHRVRVWLPVQPRRA